jgi:mannose-6-phosphate isomerase-like protein (cupin superfamily)
MSSWHDLRYISQENVMTIDEKLLEIRQFEGAGYMPLIDYANWRVAMLRYIDELLPHKLTSMQRHDETDEVFVLLHGRCILFLGEGDDEVTAIHAQDMEPLKFYNVKRSCWHTHTLSEDASILIVENRDTVTANSPQIPLSTVQTEQLIELARRLWERDS